jgi:ankyrin repeat protein
MLLGKRDDPEMRENEQEDSPSNKCFKIERVTPLWYANLQRGFQEVLEGKVDINSTDPQGRSPLHIAAKRGILNLVKPLLDQGANINLRDAKGKTPVYLACAKEHPQVVSTLLSHQADPTIVCNRGISALHKATENGAINCVTTLIESGNIPWNLPTNSGWTPVHCAVFAEQSRVLRYLRKKGSLEQFAHVQSNHGMTPFMLAAYMEREYVGCFFVNRFSKARQKADSILFKMDSPKFPEYVIKQLEDPQASVESVFETLQFVLEFAWQDNETLSFLSQNLEIFRTLVRLICLANANTKLTFVILSYLSKVNLVCLSSSTSILWVKH